MKMMAIFVGTFRNIVKKQNEITSSFYPLKYFADLSIFYQ